MTIEEFIEARLVEWEQNAAEAIELERPYSEEFEISYEWVRLTSRRGSGRPRSSMFVPGAPTPHHVRRQVAALRSMMKHAEEAAYMDNRIEGEWGVGSRDLVNDPVIDTLMHRDIAAIWSDHPEFRKEWATEASAPD